MGKKGKRRFNQTLDVDFKYSNSSVMDGPETEPAASFLTPEQIVHLQRIKATLPSAPQAVRLEEEVARIPDTGPFRLILSNVPYSAKKKDIEDFFHPLVPACVNMDDNGQNHGYCSVDFASKADLIEGFQKNEAYLLSRRVSIRVATSGEDDRSFYGGRDDFRNRRSNFGGYYNDGFNSRRHEPPGESTGGWVRRAVRPPPPPTATSNFSESAAAPTAAPSAPAERPVIRLKPRTKPLEADENEAAVSARHAAIFGAAKPVDIVAREREIEEKMKAARLNDNDNSRKSVPPAGDKSSDQQAQQQQKQQQQAPRLPQASGNPPPKNAWSKPLVPPKS
ncbi:hypothetical protein Aperf_G00000115692 [Anoplocephala perfoliata]